jgi:putative transposase
MPKHRRSIAPNSIHHIVNRGNDKKVIFRESVDYGSFLVLLREARERYPVELYAYCLMPNHFHLVVRTPDLDAISAYMHFVECVYACDLRSYDRSKGHGHIFQRRYWNKPVEGAGYLMTVMKYVEANPVRAGLVDWAHEWEWSSMWERVTGERDLLHPSPVRLPEDWPLIVTVPLEQIDIDKIRRPLKRGWSMPDAYEYRKMTAGLHLPNSFDS